MMLLLPSFTCGSAFRAYAALFTAISPSTALAMVIFSIADS